MKKKLKLFIWTGFSPDYSSGLAFAIAHDTRRQCIDAMHEQFIESNDNHEAEGAK